MRKSTLTIALFSILIFIFLSACTGADRLAASSWPGVTAAGSHVYISFGQHVYALDAADGRELWRFPEEPENSQTFFSAPAAAAENSRLFAAGYDNILYSIDAETGDLAGWTFNEASNRYIADLLVVDDTIYAANGNGSLYALDLDGNPAWDGSYDTGEPIWAAPTLADGVLYFASLDHRIHAVDAATGEQVWTRDLETASNGIPVVADGVLYIGTFGSRVFALDAASGDELWTFETADWVFGSVAVAGGVVYAGDIGGVLYAIDAAAGSEIWTFQAEGGIYGGPLVIDSGEDAAIVHFGTDTGQFYALTETGEIDWFYTAAGRIYSPARFNGEYIFVATVEGDVLLTALDTSGTARWPFTPEENE